MLRFGIHCSFSILLNNVVTVSTQPKCISSYNITRDISFQYPQGVSRSISLRKAYLGLITLDSIPTDCNLLLTGVSVTTSKSCGITLQLLDKIGNSADDFSKSIVLTQEQQMPLPEDMMQVDFNVADKYHVNQTLYMAMTLSPRPNCTLAMKMGEPSYSLTVEKEIVTKGFKLADTPIVTYRFGGQSNCVQYFSTFIIRNDKAYM